MSSLRRSLQQSRALYLAGPVVVCCCSVLTTIVAAHSWRQTQAAAQSPPPQTSQQVEARSSAQDDEAIFEKRIPAGETAFLSQYAGKPSGMVFGEKQFRKLMQSFVPGCMFHYGRDMPLSDALDIVMNHSPQQVQVRAGRYVTISGRPGPYLAGRGFLWIDMQEGIGLGGFYFHPTNGEPTPTIAVFSRQVRTKDKSLGLSQIPPAFIVDLNEWTENTGLPDLTTTYFITGSNKRILLEHDEDYCAPGNEPPLASPDTCEQMDANAADLDLTAAYYLREVNYATNATAWMIPNDQIAWIDIRDSTCGIAPDPLGCRIRLTRERVRIVVGREPPPRMPPPNRPQPAR